MSKEPLSFWTIVFYFLITIPATVGGGIAWLYGAPWYWIVAWACIATIICGLAFVLWVYSLRDWSH